MFSYCFSFYLCLHCHQAARRTCCLVRSCMVKLQHEHWSAGRQKQQFKAQLKASLRMGTWWTPPTVTTGSRAEVEKRGKVVDSRNEMYSNCSHYNLSSSDCSVQPSKSSLLQKSCSEIHWTPKTKLVCVCESERDGIT